MPIHNWAAAPSGLFHHFHQQWTAAICDALNAGRLPKGFYALIEQHAGDVVPDGLTLHRLPRSKGPADRRGAVAVADAPPNARLITRATEEDVYAAKANRVVVRESSSRDVVAAIEVVSPGNKHSKRAIHDFLDKSLDFLKQGVNLLIVDLFPPTPRDSQGIHKALWDEIRDEPFELPPEKRLTLAAYIAGVPTTAYVEPVTVGDPLPDMPVFLDRENYVLAPLEATYQETWALCPDEFKEDVLRPAR
jgi:hypothetical protein